MTQSAPLPLRVAGLMRRRLQLLIGGQSVTDRVLRGSFWTVSKLGGDNVLRLASNLILTRLLFPEAFGIMAIVQVFLAGLKMFSETGIRASIIQNARGDDPDFLNTAWTIQVGRGVVLWLGACALALPAAAVYGEPLLAQILPVAGLNAVIAGFNPTSIYTANRHLVLGRLTVLELFAQGVVITVMVGLAWLMQSVWALVVGGLFGSVLNLVLYRSVLPGIRNRFRWEPAAARQLFHFGKYIFISTAAGFVITNADRAVLGGFISLAELGIYNIAYFLAGVPRMLHSSLVSRILFPLYRMKSPAKSEDNRRKIFRVRRALNASMLLLNLALAFAGVFLINLLYDPRYAAAGPMLVLFSLAMVPRIVFSGYGDILLAHGDSRRQLYLVVSIAVLQTILLVAGITTLGVVGAILAPALAVLFTAPLRAAFARHYNALDHADWAFLTVGLALGGVVCWLHRDAILALLG